MSHAPAEGLVTTSQSWGRASTRDDAGLFVSYATPERVKEAKLEALQRRIDQGLQTAQRRLDLGEESPSFPGPRSKLESEASDAYYRPRPQAGGSVDQFQALIVPPALGDNGSAMGATSKLIVKGHAHDYQQLKPKIPGTVEPDINAAPEPDGASSPTSPHGRRSTATHGRSASARMHSSAAAAASPAAAARTARAGSSNAATPGSPSASASGRPPSDARRLRESFSAVSPYVPVEVSTEGLPEKALRSSSHAYDAARSQLDLMRTAVAAAQTPPRVATSSAASPARASSTASTSPWLGFVKGASEPAAAEERQDLSVVLDPNALGYALQAKPGQTSAKQARPQSAATQQQAQQQRQQQGEAAAAGPGSGTAAAAADATAAAALPRTGSWSASHAASTLQQQVASIVQQQQQQFQRPAAPPALQRSHSATLPPRSAARPSSPGRDPYGYSLGGGGAHRTFSLTRSSRESKGATGVSSQAGGATRAAAAAQGATLSATAAAERLSRATPATMVPTRKTMAKGRSGRLFTQTNRFGELFSSHTPSVSRIEAACVAKQREDLQYRVLEYRAWQVQTAPAIDRSSVVPDHTPPTLDPRAVEHPRTAPARIRPDSAPAGGPAWVNASVTLSRPFSAVPGLGGGTAPVRRPLSAVSMASSRPGSATTVAVGAANLASKRVRPPSAGMWAGRPATTAGLKWLEEGEEEAIDCWDASTTSNVQLMLTAAGATLPVPGTG